RTSRSPARDTTCHVALIRPEAAGRGDDGSSPNASSTAGSGDPDEPAAAAELGDAADPRDAIDSGDADPGDADPTESGDAADPAEPGDSGGRWVTCCSDVRKSRAHHSVAEQPDLPRRPRAGVPFAAGNSGRAGL